MNERSYYSKKRKPNRVGSLASLADVLPGLCQNLELDKKVNEMALLALWPRQMEILMGPEFLQNTRAIRLKKRGYQRILFVKVSNASLASALSFQLPVLKAALNGFSPQTGLTVDDIQLSVGTV